MMYQAMRSFRSDPDAVAGKHIDRALVRRVFRLARPYRRLLVGFLITAIAASIVVAIPPLLFRSLLDTAVPEKDRVLVTWLALSSTALAIASPTALRASHVTRTRSFSGTAVSSRDRNSNGGMATTIEAAIAVMRKPTSSRRYGRARRKTRRTRARSMCLPATASGSLR